MVPITLEYTERSAIEAAIEARRSFIVRCEGHRDEAVAFVEEAIESRGFKCRIYQAGRSAAAAAGLLTPTGIGQVFGAVTMVGVAAHRLATFDPDWEIAKQIGTLRVVWTRSSAQQTGPAGEGDADAQGSAAASALVSNAWLSFLVPLLSKHIEAIALNKSDLYEVGRIPEKKMRNALAAYAPVDPDRVLYLYDCTLFGAGDDGFVITDSGFFFKEFLISPPVNFAFADVAEIRPENNTLMVILADGRSIPLPGTNGAYRLEPLMQCLLEMLRSPFHREEQARLESLRSVSAEDPRNGEVPQGDADWNPRPGFEQHLDRLIFRFAKQQDKLHRAGNIPQAKLQGATEAYVRADVDDVLWLYDSTLTGSGREGFCVSPLAFYCNSDNAAHEFYFSDVTAVDLSKRGLAVTLSDGSSQTILRGSSSLYLLEFKKFLAHLIENPRVVVPVDHSAERHRLIQRGDICALLSVCADEDLDPIVRVLTSSITCFMEADEEYKKNHQKHSNYHRLIAAEICAYAGNSFTNLVRGGGPAYRDTLKVACKAVGPDFDDDLVETERRILVACLGSDWEAVAPEQVRDACKDSVLAAGVGQAAWGAASSFMRGGHPLVGAAGAIAGPGYRVLIPCIVHVARLRMRYLQEASARPAVAPA